MRMLWWALQPIRSMLLFVVTALIVAVLAGCAPTAKVFVGGPVLTMNARDEVAGGVAIRGDRIAAVGSDREMRAWAREHGAEIVELNGRAIVPGFIDAHSHFPAAGLSAISADLSSPPIGTIKSIDDIVARLQAHAEASSGWIVGIAYDDTLLRESRHLTRRDLDRVSTDRPVIAVHVSAHFASLNSVALRELEIDAKSKDPEGGILRREPSGEPDGVLEETAATMVIEKVMVPGNWAAFKATRHGSDLYAAAGITTAQVGYGSAKITGGLRLLSRFGFLPIRVVVWPAEEYGDGLLDGTLEASPRDPWFALGAVKLVADGSIQGYTAYLKEPYFKPRADHPGERGYPRIERDRLIEWVGRLHRAGLQVAIHGNGDATIDDILDAIEAAQSEHPRPDARHVIVHAQTAREDQLDRMAKLGVIPSFFVLHTYYWADRHRDIFLGPERTERISPTASAAKRGIPFTIHTDTPVTPMEPLRLVWSAVNRRSVNGHIIGPDQRIEPMRALRAVTIDAARQHFHDGDRGSLEAEKFADLVVLDRSPLDDPATIDRIQVVETIVGGKTVYRREN